MRYYHIKGKQVNSLFWVHIQAQGSALQTLTITFPGHWAFTIHISIWISITTAWGVDNHSHATRCRGFQICPHRYPFTIYYLLLVERSNVGRSALLRGTTSRRTGRVLNSGIKFGDYAYFPSQPPGSLVVWGTEWPKLNLVMQEIFFMNNDI